MPLTVDGHGGGAIRTGGIIGFRLLLTRRGGNKGLCGRRLSVDCEGVGGEDGCGLIPSLDSMVDGDLIAQVQEYGYRVFGSGDGVIDRAALQADKKV